MTRAVVVGGVLLSVINLYVDSSSIHGDISSNGCEEDHQCHSHEFCFLETHSCAPCYNCASYNRKPSEGKSCSKEPLDCGQCMEGHKADRLTTGIERDYCVKVDQDKQLPNEEEILTLPLILGIIGGLFVLILIIIIIALCIKYKRKRKPPHCQENVENGEGQNGEERNSGKPLISYAVLTGKQENEEPFEIHTPSAPPPYESQIALNLDTRNVHSEKQMATPFLYPEFPYFEEGAPSVDSDEVSEHEMPEVVDQEFHDADTLDAWSEDEVEDVAINNNVEEINSTPRCISESQVFENAEASSGLQNDSGISQTSSVVTSTRSLDMTEEVDDGDQPSRKRPRNDSGTHTSEINISADINSQSQEDRN